MVISPFSRQGEEQGSLLKCVLTVLFVAASVAAAAGVLYVLFTKLEKKRILRFKKCRQVYRSADLESDGETGDTADTSEETPEN